jgi:NAD(P)H-flavin reductase
VLLIAGGVGITPIRALLEDLPGERGAIAVVYRALREEDVILREELETLAARRGVEVHYVLGEHRDGSACSRRSTSCGSSPTSASATSTSAGRRR